jgi:hypothetical protein
MGCGVAKLFDQIPVGWASEAQPTDSIASLVNAVGCASLTHPTPGGPGLPCDFKSMQETAATPVSILSHDFYNFVLLPGLGMATQQEAGLGQDRRSFHRSFGHGIPRPWKNLATTERRHFVPLLGRVEVVSGTML